MNSLKAISISHQTAELKLREQFTLTIEEQSALLKGLQEEFDVRGALILATCNRTELYLEGKNINTNTILDYLFAFKQLDKGKELTLLKYL